MSADARRLGTPPLPLGVQAQQVPLPCEPGEAPLARGSLPSLAAALARVPEHRRPRGYRAAEPPYPLVPLLLLLLTGVLCGRRGYGSIAAWAESVGQVDAAVLDALGCPSARKRRTPAAATLFRCVRDLDRAAFQAALQDWLHAVAAALGPAGAELRGLLDQVAVDGKTVRGASARQADAAGVHLVAAYAPALQVVLDQVETVGKGHELAAAEALLGRLALKGRVITADALLTQRSICAAIVAGHGDYVLPVKDNQPTLLADLETAFSPGGAERVDAGRAAEAASGGGGAAAAAARPAGCGARRGSAAGPQAAARAPGGAAALDTAVGGPAGIPGLGRGSRNPLARRSAGSTAAAAGAHPAARGRLAGEP